MARASGVIVFCLALAFGAALLLDVGGLQAKLFGENPPERPAVTAKLSGKAPDTAPAPAAVTPAWYVGANGLDGAELERQAARALMVIYFQKPRCEECRRFEREVLAASEVRSFLAGVVKVRVDPGDGDREQKLARRFGVEHLPALAVVPQRGPPHLVPLERGGSLLSPHQLVAYCR
jgi:thiol:disulfide interchange protein